MAAVAESAATTRWRDEPRTANTAIGRSIVYRPVTSGIPAIFAYLRTSGMPRAASVMPASTSVDTRDRSMGSTVGVGGQHDYLGVRMGGADAAGGLDAAVEGG
jgi:hypothetical protein